MICGVGVFDDEGGGAGLFWGCLSVFASFFLVCGFWLFRGMFLGAVCGWFCGCWSVFSVLLWGVDAFVS